jgi:RHH-type proline utilization regulon transcriptional repressor/proline dehydrogenase/delta 1-pyrroline-5-carboxylate dehydrogenase
MFTGSTDVARILQRSLARRVSAFGEPVPLVAETGGQNAMICDSSALAEQVVSDAVASAFDSAGQRCSALRVLCVQDDIAERLLEMLKGAMAELHVGNPDDIAVDVGPLIDEDARAGILAHVDAMRAKGHRVYQAPDGEGFVKRGHFVAPTLIEIDRVSELEREVFGPVLHVVRYPREALDTLVDEINALGFGLTLGVHSRIDERIARVVERARVGNIYVNRNMIGAVVGVQPFGGEGLSGTGPKAGGPLYLYRLLSDYPGDAVIRRLRALAPEALGARAASPAADAAAFESLRAWCASGTRGDCALPLSFFEHLVSSSPAGTSYPLPGPTGESNTYMLHARDRVLGIAGTSRDSLAQLAAVLALGSNMLWHESDMTHALFDALPEAVRERVVLVPHGGDTSYDAVLYHGGARGLEDVLAMVAGKAGPVVPVSSYAAGDDDIRLERLCVERVISVNTAAAGGNAALMTVG